MTMALIDYTMSPDLIKGWIKKVRPFLKCEDPAKLDFERTVKEVHEKVIERDGLDYEADEGMVSGAARIMPFEFLYLLCNARPRMDEVMQLKVDRTGV